MSKLTYWRPGLAGLLAAGLAGCAASSQPTTAPTTVAPTTAAVWACLDGLGAVPFAVPDEPAMHAAQLGDGVRAVVFSNQSDEGACAWADFAAELAGLGYRAVLYDYTDDVPQLGLAAVVRAVVDNGATSVALIGASRGAKTSIAVAAGATPVDALVSLSAERKLGGTNVASWAGQLRVPTLFVTADQDPYGATAATQAFYDAAPATDKRLLVRPGTAHGTALLADPEVHQAILDFLGSHDG